MSRQQQTSRKATSKRDILLRETVTSGNSKLKSVLDDALENPESEEQDNDVLLDNESLLEPVETRLKCVESELENASCSVSSSKHIANDIKPSLNVTHTIVSGALNKPNVPKSSVSTLLRRLKCVDNKLPASFKMSLPSPKLSFFQMMHRVCMCTDLLLWKKYCVIFMDIYHSRLKNLGTETCPIPVFYCMIFLMT